MNLFKGIFFGLIMLLGSSVARSQSLSLDTTFNGNGLVLTPKSGLMTQATHVIQQPDGKLLVGGQITLPHPFWTVSSFFLYRLNTNGLIDVTFADTGKFQTKQNPIVLQQTADFIQCMTLQPDNKIILAGAFNENLCLMRLKPNGTVDSTFATNGKVETDLGQPDENIRSIVLLNNGAILAAVSQGSDFVLIKYNNNGTIDTTFGTSGISTVDFNQAKDDCSTIILQPDGKIVMVGSSWDNATGYDFAVARFNANGSLDAGFGNAGKLLIDFGTLFDYGDRVHRRSNGNLVVTGYTQLGDGKSKYAVAEVNASGVLNLLFGIGGKSVANTNLRENFSGGSALQSNGDVLIGGISSDFAANSTKPLIMKVNAAGSFDYGLNGTGFFYYQQASENNIQFYDLNMQQDGKIVGVGHSNYPGDYRMNAVRFVYKPPVNTTFIKEESKLGCRLYPNPSNDLIFIDAPQNSITRTELMNLQGEVLLKQKGDEPIKVSALVKGIYLMLIWFEDGHCESQKVIVQ